MTPDEHVNHGDHQPQPEPEPVLETEPKSPKPLLENATVTIYFDGLIYMAYNEARRLYQGAVLTEAEGHHLVIEVRLRGEEEKLLFPLKPTDWDPDHATVKAKAPFWLYVDSGQGIQEKEFSATLNLPANDDEQSFTNIFNFEKQYQRPIFPKPPTFAEFNFPHGISYSAENTNAALKTISRAGGPVTFKENIRVSTLAAVDIDAVSNDAGKKSIVLANNEGKTEFFRFDLEPGKLYEIKILNQPVDQHTSHHAQDHFLQFYELFDLKAGEEEFLVAPPLPPSQDSPPCVSTTGNTKSGLDH